MTDDLLALLAAGPLYGFADWPNPEVPNWRAGVYTVWDDELLVYVGMAGRSLLPGSHESEEAVASTRNRGLRDRLNSHASGRRSGDQFCVYVFDRLVLPTLSQKDIADAANGRLSLDARTRAHIREHLTYRFVLTVDGRAALLLERQVQGGALGQPPTLNPGRR